MSGKKGSARTQLAKQRDTWLKDARRVHVQEEVIPFFQQVRFSKEADTALKCMRELAEQLRDDLKRVDAYFEKLADGMVAWCDCWEALNPEGY